MSMAHLRQAEQYLLDAPRSAAEHSVLNALAYYANKSTGECWPSLQRISAYTGLAVSTVSEAIKELEAAGVVSKRGRSRGEGRGRTSNMYALSLPDLTPAVGIKSDPPEPDLIPAVGIKSEPRPDSDSRRPDSDSPRLDSDIAKPGLTYNAALRLGRV